MQQSVLDEISNIGSTYIYYDEWRNNKTGSIADVRGNGVYRFVEVERYKSGHFKHIHENTEDDPIVIVGIVAYWLKNRRNTNRLVTMFEGKAQRNKDIKEQFDSYTQWRFEQFKTQHKDDPSSWKWDWDYEFYAKYIIPHELMLNKQTEALFEYITDDDIKQVRAVMNNYIEYLKLYRTEHGYEVCDELKVLRSYFTNDSYLLEDMDDYTKNEIIEQLEKKDCVSVTRVYGDNAWSVTVTDKGKAYMEHLEKQMREKQNDGLSELEQLRKENEELRAKISREEDDKEAEIVKELASCFYGNEEDTRDFLKQIRNVQDRDKPAIAKQYLDAKKLSGLSSKRPLWTILKRYGLYSKGESNWSTLFNKA